MIEAECRADDQRYGVTIGGFWLSNPVGSDRGSSEWIARRNAEAA